ncbi:MAG: ABC transporter permease [Chloroflexia bacterium]|nr:ABC transporter permease [Chloroflexia bacterium]
MAVSEQKVSRDDLGILQRKVRTPWRDAYRQLIKNKMAVGGVVFIVLLILMAILADYVNPYRLQGYGDTLVADNSNPYAKQLAMSTRVDTAEAPLVKPFGVYKPTAESKSIAYDGFRYLFGADNLGRDIFSRVIYGARVSLEVAFIGAIVSFIIGMTYGMVSAYFGGQVDNVMMRIVDILWGYPPLIFIILLQVYFKALTISYEKQGEQANALIVSILDLNRKMGGILLIFIALGALNWLGMARLVRGQVLSYKEKEFVEAARCIGANNRRILFIHLLPNVLGPCIVSETMAIPGYIYTEAFLSFIGLGVNAPTPSWGIMLSEAYQGMRSFWWPVVFPAIALSLTVLAFNFFGDGLRDALDPRVYER